MSAYVLDSGALVAIDRGDRAMVARIGALERQGHILRTTGAVIVEVWRDERGRQVHLARALKAIEVHPVDDTLGRAAGVLLGKVTADVDVADATVAAAARSGDTILTSDPEHIGELLRAARHRVRVVRV